MRDCNEFVFKITGHLKKSPASLQNASDGFCKLNLISVPTDLFARRCDLNM